MAEIGTAQPPSFLSVVMCTRNRAASLERALNSIADMIVPTDLPWEMVLVDNGSTDHTASVAESFTHKMPIRRIFEPKAGLSNARNTGVVSARGDYILWTDDDVEVDKGWLAGYSEAFTRFPDGVVFGGQIIPRLETPTPAWFKENLNILCDVLAVRDFGDEYLSLTASGDLIPYGANYAIRTAEQRQHLYDPQLGVGPGRRTVGEEVTVMAELFAAGYSGYWVPDAKVFHIISASRQTEKYIRAYYSGHGETSAFRFILSRKRTRFQVIVSQGLHTFANVILYHTIRPFASPRLWLRRLKKVGFHSGALKYALKHRIGSDA